MRFLIDENLSWRMAELLNNSGHDAIHLRDLGATGAPDSRVVELAMKEDRIIISADTDFGALLAHTRATRPSVILVRGMVGLRPPELAGVITANLETIEHHLEAGAVAAFTHEGIRVRQLPLR